MKLEIDLKTEFDDTYFRNASLFHALDHIKNKIQAGKIYGSFDYESKGYGADWDLKESKE